MKKQFLVFIMRWILNTIGIWVAIRLLGSGFDSTMTIASTSTYIVAGLIFSLVNTILKPIVIILSLPAILLTLGLFTIVVNGLMVYISLGIAPGISMSFGNSILAGIILSLVNYIVSGALDLHNKPKIKE